MKSCNAQMKFICHVMVLVENFSIGYYNIKSNYQIQSYSLQMLASARRGGGVIHLKVLKPTLQMLASTGRGGGVIHLKVRKLIIQLQDLTFH